MARDTVKNDYITLAIPHDSLLHQALLADAAASGKALSAIALLRLADYYRGRGQPATPEPAISAASTSTPLEAIKHPSASVDLASPALPKLTPSTTSKTGGITSRSEETKTEEIQEFSLESSRARANAVAALEALDSW